ncbi:MAG: Fe(3+) ABC transporter substrate-binding protein [Pseudomonadales bacterium]
MSLTSRVITVAFSALSIAFTSGVHASGDVNVYSARKEALIKPLLDKFEQQSNINVNLITGKADALLQRLKIEGKASPADIFITVDAGRLQRAKEAGVLQPIENAVLAQRIPANLRDGDNLWFSLSQRARTIFYAKDKVNTNELSSYQDLATPKWKGKLCLRSSNNIYNQSLVASMIENIGAEKTQAWIEGMMSNLVKPPFGGDTDLLRAVAAGVCDVTIANTYYYGRLLNSDAAKDKDVTERVGLFWANQTEQGVHMNVSGAGITKSSKHKDNAIKLLEFLTSAESQAWYAAVNSEFPVLADAQVSDNLRSFGAYIADPIALNKLGENNRQAVEIMDRAGWK